MNENEYVFCPFCARYLETKMEEEKPRKFCNSCKWTHYPAPHIAVAGVVTRISDKNLNPEVLVVKRNREPFKNRWMFPAGFLEVGEHPEEALTRELIEETGLRVTRSKLITILEATSDPRSSGHLVFFYHVETTGEIINNDQEENSAVEWQSINSAIDLGFSHHKTVLEIIKSKPWDYFNF